MPDAFQYDVFLSHNSKDKPKVRRLAERLKAAGVRVWLDEWVIQAGDIIALKVDEGLEQSRVLLLCISPAALASGWVALERSTAIHRDPANAGRRFIPLLLGDCALPDTLRRYKYVDFREESEAAFAEIATAIQQRASYKRPEIRTREFAETTTVSVRKPNNLPFPPNPYFRGRGETLSRINDVFTNHRTAALTQSLAVSGQGGIGKTQTAIEYAWQYESRYAALLWVSCESPQLFRSGLASLAGPAALDLGSNAGEDMKVLMDKVLRWLKQHEDWLLVCDNADSAKAIEAIMAEVSPAMGGYLLITSRLSELPATIQTEQLDILAEEDAVAFLLHRSGRPVTEQNQAGYVASALGCFPLALDQAAAGVRATSSSWPDYIEKLNRTPRSALGYPSAGGVNYSKTILTTWEINFSELNHLSRQVLRYISLQAGEPIPESLFQHQHAKWNVSGEQLEGALLELTQYCLAKRRNGGISIHRLTQFVVRNTLNPTERSECLSSLLALFELHCTGDAADGRTWRTWDAMLPHALSIIDACDRESLHSEKLVRLIQNAALFIQSKHRPEDAMHLLELGQTISTRHSPNSIEAAKAKNSLGGCLWQLGRSALSLGDAQKSKDYFLKAESLNRESVFIAENLRPADKEFLAIALNNWGNCQRDLGLASEAEQTLRRALEIDIANRGELHPKVAIRRNNLGQLLMGQKRFTEAETEFFQALKISEAEFGELDPVIVIRYSALGQLKLQTGDYKEAEKFFRKSLEIAEQVLPEENPNRRRAVQQFENVCALVRNSACRKSP